MAALGSARPGSDLAYNSIFARRPQKSSAKEGFALALLMAYEKKAGGCRRRWIRLRKSAAWVAVAAANPFPFGNAQHINFATSLRPSS